MKYRLPAIYMFATLWNLDYQ